MADIVLVAVNANYIHAPFGLFCLRSALGPLRSRSRILEFSVKSDGAEMTEAVVAEAPKVVGFAVYLWNRDRMVALAGALRARLPGVVLVAGGPEVTGAPASSDLRRAFDHCIDGPGEEPFRRLCTGVLGAPAQAPAQAPAVDQFSPYDEYTDHDLRHRLTYVEASRGCAFRCSFCTSADGPRVENLPLGPFLADLGRLVDRGARRIKFLDRSFNLDIGRACAIVDWFLDRPEIRHPDPNREFFVHFELVPDRVPAELGRRLARFPAGTLRLEVGVQTLDPAVSAAIRRPLNGPLVLENLRFLVEETSAIVHADLIAGLPGEDLAGFGRGVDTLWEVLGRRPGCEVQLGILKRLPGTPLDRAPEPGAVFRAGPPYDLLASPSLGQADVALLNDTARLWERIVNRGRFPGPTARLLGGDGAPGQGPFDRFHRFSSWFVDRHHRSWGIPQDEVGRTLEAYLAR